LAGARRPEPRGRAAASAPADCRHGGHRPPGAPVRGDGADRRRPGRLDRPPGRDRALRRRLFEPVREPLGPADRGRDRGALRGRPGPLRLPRPPHGHIIDPVDRDPGGKPTITINRNDRFVVSGHDSRIDGAGSNGFFAADTRFVSGYRILVNGRDPVLLTSAATHFFASRYEFANPDMFDTDG